MKVLHLVGGKLSGGAARGAYWLHQGLRELGLDSAILGNSKQTLDDPNVFTTASSATNRIISKLSMRLDTLLCAPYAQKKQGSFSTGLMGVDVTRTPQYRDADLIHLHWINEGLVNLRHLRKTTKPMIWTMRDMWPMTGGCHYAVDCRQYRTGCGKCPQLGSRRDYDLSRLVWKRKKRLLPKNIKIVGISRWLSECAEKSALLRHFDVRTIHNNINTREFFPLEKPLARKVLGLPPDRPIVLAGAQRLDDPYKGFSVLIKALRSLPRPPLLLLFGHLAPSSIRTITHDFVHLGFLRDAVLLRLAYSAADVFAAPSRIDAFGKTLAEAMACGTPSVCFDAAGPRDIVDHLINGYRATSGDAQDLARGIAWVLNHPEPDFLARKSRDKVEQEFDSLVVARKYKQLYRDVLEKGRLRACGR